MTYEQALKALAIGMQKLPQFEPAIRYKRNFKAWEVEFRSPSTTYRYHNYTEAANLLMTLGVTPAQMASIKPMPELVEAAQKLLT